MAWRWAGTFVSLEATTKVISGERGIEFVQFGLQLNAFDGVGTKAFDRLGDVLRLLAPLRGEFFANGLLEFNKAFPVFI